MNSSGIAVSRHASDRYTAVQMRIIAAAVDLFAEHGVNGSSLQMIADAIGVTKAAIYHQFPTKEAIVVAAVEVELESLDAALDAAEAGGPGRGALDILLTQVIDLAVSRRNIVRTLQYDPVVIQLFEHHEPFQRFIERLCRVLLDEDTNARGRVRAAMIASAIGGAVTHPLVADLDDTTLRTELLHYTRCFLDLKS